MIFLQVIFLLYFQAGLPPVQRRKLLRVGVSLSQRYSEPPTQNHPYYPLRDMHSIEELSRKNYF